MLFSVEVANIFIKMARQDERPLDQMQLQKLVYIAHGWHLAINDGPLTHDRPLASELGPEYPCLRETTFGRGTLPILDPIEWHEESLELSSDREVISRVYDKYSGYESYKLAALTREEGTPWVGVYLGERRSKRIPDELIQKYFMELALAGRSTDTPQIIQEL